MRFFGVLILILIKLISLLSGLDTARWSVGQTRIVVLDIYLLWVGTSHVEGASGDGVFCCNTSLMSRMNWERFSVSCFCIHGFFILY